MVTLVKGNMIVTGDAGNKLFRVLKKGDKGEAFF